jgi:hypothetical protein
MAVFNLTAAQPLMKVFFNPRISKQFNTAAVLWNRYADGKGIPISNRGMEIPTHLQPNANFNWFTDGGTLPTGGSEALTSALVGFFSFVESVQLTGAALDAAGNDAVTYARALAFNIKMATINAIKYLNIYSFLDGTGILGTIGGSITLNGGSNTTGVNITGSIEAGHYLRPGMQVAFLSGLGPTVKATTTIVSLDQPIEVASGASMTVAPSTGVTSLNLVAGDSIVVTGSSNGADSFNNVLSGLKVIVDNGSITPTFQNVNRATNNQYNAGVIALAGSPALARDHLRRMLATVQILQGRVSPSLEFISHPSQLHAYMDMGWTLKRFNDANKKLDLGYTAVEWEGFPWIIDTDCPKDHIFAVDRDVMFKVVARELSFDDRTGSILRQVPAQTAGQYSDAFVAFLIFRGNLGTYVPNAHVKLNGLSVPVGY